MLNGSSPLTRGKLGRDRRRRRGVRLIPAHAGKTDTLALGGFGDWAHPRSRGENGRSNIRKDIEMGSSPLTRGKQATKWRPDLRVGLIPAHAGKTRRRRGG